MSLSTRRQYRKGLLVDGEFVSSATEEEIDEEGGFSIIKHKKRQLPSTLLLLLFIVVAGGSIFMLSLRGVKFTSPFAITVGGARESLIIPAKKNSSTSPGNDSGQNTNYSLILHGFHDMESNREEANNINTVAPAERPHVFAESLLSDGAEVTASVRGNLGPPSVVTTTSTANWLTDRWQAAKNMKGEAIPGAHWLTLAPKESAWNVSRILIDYESAYADNYEIEVFCDNKASWATLFNSKSNKPNIKVKRAEQHVIHSILISEEVTPCGLSTPSISKIRLNIKRPAERWGTSIWSFLVWGYVEVPAPNKLHPLLGQARPGSHK